jgi:hypothetical protein
MNLIINRCNKVRFAVSLLTFLCLVLNVQAQKVTVQVSANKVQVGTPFQIQWSINSMPNTYTPPDFKNFDIYSGPNPMQSTQIVNGNMSQSFSVSYLIAAKKEGKITIGPMVIVVNGQSFQSNPLTIEAVRGNVPPHQQQSAQSSPNTMPEEEAAAVKVSGEEVFIRTSISKTKCYLGEQLTVIQKVYSRLDLRGFQNVKFPSLNGFWSQQQESNQNIQLQVENLDGVNYYVGEFSRTHVFPQKTGKITIDPTELECVVRKQSSRKPRNIFEQFFGTGGFEDVAVKVKSKPVTVDVMPLPEKDKPLDFSGGVGSFNYKVETTKRELKANDAFNLKVTISGKGNIKLIDAPKLKLPESFESYEPKTNENISNSGGVSGSKTYDYLIIPREPGEFTLEGLSFSYYDLDKKQYVTIPSPAIGISVKPGDGKSNASAQVYDHLKQEIKETENDIRYIKKGDFELLKEEKEFFNSPAHIALLVLPVLLFIGGLGYRSYALKMNSDIVAVKGKKAAKVAKKQLISAEKRMKENNKEAFYTEIMNALNGYVSFKFNLPVAELSKENITREMNRRQISGDTQSRFFDTLNQCEYAKYAPGAVSGDLNAVYHNTAELISSIENEIKNV